MWVLHYFLYVKLVRWYTVNVFFCVPFYLVFERTKTRQKLCLSVSFASYYADCFTLRFVFNVRLSTLRYIYIFEDKCIILIYTFNFKTLLKWKPLMSFLGYVNIQKNWLCIMIHRPDMRVNVLGVLRGTCSSQIPAWLLSQEGPSPLGGARRVFLLKCGLDFKVLQFASYMS